jgi:chromosome segregation protein
LSAACNRCATRSPSCSWSNRPPRWGALSSWSSSPPPRWTWPRWPTVIEREGIKLYGLQTEIDRIQREINALGAVNLAALEELAAAARAQGLPRLRKSADLNDAIGTLEDAIHKIDLETRDLLQGPPSTPSTAFRAHVPRAVRRRQARLIITGDEILDAGVQVMAQPPGKKNSTIHLLSGGEKALTAIALVFAIFQLNPAPFCLLDEVDAPLDDANTERYAASLVKSMSSGTQFLFISPQQDRDGDGRATDRRDHAGAGRLAHRGGGHGGGA